MVKLAVAIAAGALILSAGTACAKDEEPSGKKLFEAHCVQCHKDGGNIINTQKTLKKSSLEKNGIKKKEDIVKKMRNPGPGMPKFDEKAIPEEQAEEIAEYVMKTFK